MNIRKTIYFGVGSGMSDGKETGSDGKECACDNCGWPFNTVASPPTQFSF